MFTSLIHRYLIKEILGPTLLCLLVFTMVLLMGRLIKLVDMVVNKGVSLVDIVGLFTAMAPSFLTITLPLAFLMGVMIGLGRLSADSETVALKATGFSLAKMAVPVFTLALVFAVLTGTIGIWGKAWGYRTFKSKVFEITQQKATVGFQPRIFMDQFPGLTLYANELDSRTGQMSGLFVKEQKVDSTSLIFAHQGDVYSDAKSETVIIRLHEGVIHRQKKGAEANYQLVHFKTYDVQPDLGSDLIGSRTQKGRRTLKPVELSFGDLLNRINENPDDQRINALRSELHQRLVSPLAPLLFALFGLPFSIQSHRSGRSGGFVIGLVIYLTYYVLWSLADTLTSESGVSPWLTFWFSHALLFAAGFYVLRQSSLEKTNPLVYGVDQLTLLFKRKTKSA